MGLRIGCNFPVESGKNPRGRRGGSGLVQARCECRSTHYGPFFRTARRGVARALMRLSRQMRPVLLRHHRPAPAPSQRAESRKTGRRRLTGKDLRFRPSFRDALLSLRGARLRQSAVFAEKNPVQWACGLDLISGRVRKKVESAQGSQRYSLRKARCGGLAHRTRPRGRVRPRQSAVFAEESPVRRACASDPT